MNITVHHVSALLGHSYASVITSLESICEKNNKHDPTNDQMKHKWLSNKYFNHKWKKTLHMKMKKQETRISCSYLSFEVNKKTPFILLKAPLKTSNTARKYKESTSVRNQIVMCVMWWINLLTSDFRHYDASTPHISPPRKHRKKQAAKRRLMSMAPGSHQKQDQPQPDERIFK